MSAIRASLGLAGSGIALLLLTACGSSTGGQPSPAGDASTGAAQSSNAAPPAGSSTGSPPSGHVSSLDDADPCTLLTQQDLDALGMTAHGERVSSKRSHGCQWTQGGQSLEVGIRMQQGLDGFALEGAKHVKSLHIGSHAAKQQVTPKSEACLIGIGVSSNSRVDVTVLLDDTSKECSAAKTSAKRVEKHLPPAS